MKTEKAVVIAAMRWFRSGDGFLYRGAIKEGTILNVITHKGHAEALEKACARHANAKLPKRKR